MRMSAAVPDASRYNARWRPTAWTMTLAIFIAACASGEPVWVKAGAGIEAQNKDAEACRQAAEQRLRVGSYAVEREQRRLEALSRRQSGQVGPDQTALRQIEIRDQIERERAFRDCMTARGYVLRS